MKQGFSFFMQVAVTGDHIVFARQNLVTTQKVMPLFNFGGCEGSAMEFIREDLPQMRNEEIQELARTYNPNAKHVRIFEKGHATIVEYPTRLTDRKVH